MVVVICLAIGAALEAANDHDQGRGWRGFHHHTALCTAAYGFLVAERLRGVHRKNRHDASNLPYPRMTVHAARSSRTQRHAADSIATLVG
ncbi:hypothetical protein [Xanthomonas theicola]|uniref:Uncharacterized protein n=1 Tax=Xanthomonas theicola TaxID=56464 RepID=A0A2S6ZE51_9XANT|nr:hypothetical protein XthCFBP4691_12230 [Xanthomonas theicola]QNH23491.1 hypothetical protein G4Q83_11580 [Xanthomonas theicola]